MWLRNSLLAIALSSPVAIFAQGPEVAIDPRAAFKVSFAADAPVALAAADWGSTKAVARGGALSLDLHSTLQLKNTSNRRILGVTLLVTAQEVTPGGKGSVAVPSLDIAPGESFPLRIDLRLMRPLQTVGGGGALVEVTLDGVLFEDLGFYGPNRLNSRRMMTAWEMEARRDRKHFLAVLESGGRDGLQKAMLASLARIGEQPGLAIQALRPGRSTVAGATKRVEFTFLRLPDAPLDLLAGAANVAGAEARDPQIEVQNRTRREVRYLEVGWLLRDQDGSEFAAGSVPAEVNLAPGQKTEFRKEAALRFSRQGATVPLRIDGMTGYLSRVEYSNGEVWVPARSSLAQPRLAQTLAPSAEEQRLAELYRRKGIDAVIQQLRRVH